MKQSDPEGSGSAPLFLLILSLVVSMCLVGVTSTTLAGNNPSAKAAVHVRAHNAELGCNHDTIIGCEDIVTAMPGSSVDAFPVFFNLTEFQGCEFGMTWPAWTYSAAFINCADLVIGSILLPGNGSSHAWVTCQVGVCVPCFLWIYADGPGQICPTGHPQHGFIYVLDCSEALDTPVQTFCAGVYGGTGDDPCAEGPLCGINPATLDFGTVTVGSFADLSFFIKNIGAGTLEGSVAETCDDYGITLGAGAYAIAAGESIEVVIRLEPRSSGLKECGISTGAHCAIVTCTGTGEDPPICEVTPESLDFGTVTIGQFAERNFIIGNAGGGTLEGAVSEVCDDYSITSNGGAFSLGAEQRITVGVRFTPTAPGLQECTVETGQAICADVTCTGIGEDPPQCEVVPSAVDLGIVAVGAFKDTTVRIANIGGGTLTGDPSEACADYEIIAGGDPYELGSGESHYMEIRFTPSAQGLRECMVDAGTDCQGAAFSGIGADLPRCQVEPIAIDFGAVPLGEGKDSTFRITNIGGGTLTGEPSAICEDFEIVAGGDPYALGKGESVVVTVRFVPMAGGHRECMVDAGTECDGVLCSGVGWQVGLELFIRGDDDGDGDLTIADPIVSLCAQFGRYSVTCMDASDVDDNGEVNISDPIYNLAVQFGDGPLPPAPFPGCGEDPTPDGLTCVWHDSCMDCGEGLPESEGVVEIWLGSPEKVGNLRFAYPVYLNCTEALWGFEYTVAYSAEDIVFQSLDKDGTVSRTHDFSGAAVAEAGEAMREVRLGDIVSFDLSRSLEPGIHEVGRLVFRKLSSGEPAGPTIVKGKYVRVGPSVGEIVTGAQTGAPDDGPFEAMPITVIPNPTTGRTSIRFGVPRSGPVNVSIYSVAGQMVCTLVDRYESAGGHEVSWDGRNSLDRAVPDGIYFCGVTTPGSQEIAKIILLR